MSLVTCGRFDSNLAVDRFEETEIKKIRIGSSNPNKLEKVNYIPIATDGDSVVFDKNVYSVREILALAKVKGFKALMVMTFKERGLILDALLDYGLEVSVFEKKFPIFPDTKFSSNAYASCEELKKRLSKINTFNIKGGSLAKHYSTMHGYKVERSLRHKNTLDRKFSFAYRGV